jgi:transcriptional regulator with XRE-family HTH domain
MSIGNNILKLLEQQGKSQSWLSRELKVGRGRVNNWVKDRNIPSLDDQILICKVLEVDMNTLTGVIKKPESGKGSGDNDKDKIIAKQAEEIRTLRKALKDLL